MLKKVVSLLLCIYLCACSVVLAKSVIVTGVGDTKEQSVADAKRIAVEQVAGSYITAHSYMKNFQTELDEVTSQSQGYITSYKVVSEQKRDNLYYTTLDVDVDISENSLLVDRLRTISELRNPRIGVIVFDISKSSSLVDGAMQSTNMGNNDIAFINQSIISSPSLDSGRSDSQYYTDVVKNSINKALLSMGFAHVMDVPQVVMQKKAEMLKDIAAGKNWSGASDNALDYLIVGQCAVIDTNKIMFPAEGYAKDDDTGLTAANVSLGFKVFQYDTGILAGTGRSTGKGIDITANKAIDKAFQKVSEECCKDIKNTLDKKAVSINSIDLIINFGSPESKVKGLKAIKEMSGIGETNIYEEKETSIKMYVNTYMTPQDIVKLLKGSGNLEMISEEVNHNSAKLYLN